MTRPSTSAKTNWPMVFWPIAILWSGFAVTIYFTGYLECTPEVLGFAAVAIVMLVLLANALTHDWRQEQVSRANAFAGVTACTQCGQTDCHLESVYYEYMVFLGAIALQRSIAGRMCEPCARRIVNRAFLASIVGCILFPPLILLPWWKRRTLFARFAHRA